MRTGNSLFLYIWLVRQLSGKMPAVTPDDLIQTSASIWGKEKMEFCMLSFGFHTFPTACANPHTYTQKINKSTKYVEVLFIIAHFRERTNLCTCIFIVERLPVLYPTQRSFAWHIILLWHCVKQQILKAQRQITIGFWNSDSKSPPFKLILSCISLQHWKVEEHLCLIYNASSFEKFNTTTGFGLRISQYILNYVNWTDVRCPSAFIG